MNSLKYFWRYCHSIWLADKQLALGEAEYSLDHGWSHSHAYHSRNSSCMWIFSQVFSKLSIALQKFCFNTEYWVLNNIYFKICSKTYLATLLLYQKSHFLSLNTLMNLSSLEAQAGWAPALNFLEELLKQVQTHIWPDGQQETRFYFPHSCSQSMTLAHLGIYYHT